MTYTLYHSYINSLNLRLSPNNEFQITKKVSS